MAPQVHDRSFVDLPHVACPILKPKTPKDRIRQIAKENAFLMRRPKGYSILGGRGGGAKTWPQVWRQNLG